MHKPTFNISQNTTACTAFDLLIAARGRGLTATAYELYLELVAEARKAKEAVKMLKEEVAKRLRVCKKTVTRACKQLVEAGLVAYTPGNGRGHASEYKVEGIKEVPSEPVKNEVASDVVAKPQVEEPKPQPKKKEAAKSKKKDTEHKQFVLPIGELSFLPTEKFHEAWGQFVAHRKEIKKPLKTQRMIDMQFKGFKGFTEEEIVDAIETCIASGWTGIFPRKKQDYKKDYYDGVPKHKTRVVNGKRQKIAGDAWETDGSEYDGLSQDEIWDKIMAS